MSFKTANHLSSLSSKTQIIQKTTGPFWCTWYHSMFFDVPKTSLNYWTQNCHVRVQVYRCCCNIFPIVPSWDACSVMLFLNVSMQGLQAATPRTKGCLTGIWQKWKTLGHVLTMFSCGLPNITWLKFSTVLKISSSLDTVHTKDG